MKKYIVLFFCLSCVFLQAQEKYSWENDLKHRIALDFNKSKVDMVKYIQQYIPDVTDEQLDAWEVSNTLEWCMIDGEKRYFRNAAPNLFRVDKTCRTIKNLKDGISLTNSQRAVIKNMPEVMKEASQQSSHLGAGKRMRVKFTVTVNADVIPAGQKIRCWLPYPRTDITHQKDVKLLYTSEKKYKIAPESCKHSTIYMEKKAVPGQKTVFSEIFEYTSYGAWYNLRPEEIKPYNKNSALYLEYTSEREKHIIFTPELKRLAAELTEGVTNPLHKAKKIFRYITANYPWASAREYSTIENIPMYVLKNHHGDCGQVSLLFITLCRICGIPAHFQSGLMFHPGATNLHDWSEIYFEGVGWVPVDQSFGIPVYARNEDEMWFFLGGIDSWRMVANSDYGMELYPKKRYPRSETVDFQRGEVEWKGGNLYYDKWDYHWDIEYLN